MNKRLKKELRGERRGGREGHRERKRKRRREREREGEEEEGEEGEIQKKALTDVAHAVQRASTVCIVRRSPSPVLLCPCLPNSPPTTPAPLLLHHYPNIPLGREQWLRCRVKML